MVRLVQVEIHDNIHLDLVDEIRLNLILSVLTVVIGHLCGMSKEINVLLGLRSPDPFPDFCKGRVILIRPEVGVQELSYCHRPTISANSDGVRMVLPSSFAFFHLLDPSSPHTRMSVLEETLDELFPPCFSMSSFI